MLALYPKEQENFFDHIKSVIPDGQKPVRTNALIFREGFNIDMKLDIRTDVPADIFHGRL